MNKLNSLSLFVGTGQCNACCAHCAGVPLREYAPKEDGMIDEALISKTVEDCYVQGARYLSISSSGEPTLSPLAVSKTFDLLVEYAKKGLKFNPINMYSNGIRIGEDKTFCETYLPTWKSQGLTTMYITVHNIDEEKNAQIYGVKSYPAIEEIFWRIKNAGLQLRANIVLSKETIGNLQEYKPVVTKLLSWGADKISSWPIRNLDDKVDSILAPSKKELDEIEHWIHAQEDICDKVKLLRETSKKTYTQGEKLTLFPNGKLSNTWCNNS